jgi:tetratricopeptide (TPR) repeat protein
VLLAMIRKSAGRDRDAIEALERALAVYPYRRDAVANLVLALGDATDPACRDPRRAVEVARDAIAHVPSARTSDLDLDAGSACNLLGYALICDGRWREGLEAAAKARELGNEQDGTDWIYEALAHAKLGEIVAARDLFDRAEAWFAEHPEPGERFARRRADVERLLAEAASR